MGERQLILYRRGALCFFAAALLLALLPVLNQARAQLGLSASIFRSVAALVLTERTAEVPILLYHHITEEPGEGGAVSVEIFNEQMTALVEAGYTAVTFADLDAFVSGDGALPDKPILITFDDGYESNYTHAYPILKEHGLKATIFVIGVSVGKNTYKETGQAMIPHFSWEQAAEMEASGVITIESHGYDLHEVAGLDEEPIRLGILRKEDESLEDYRTFLNEDCDVMQALFQEHLGKSVSVTSFPLGKNDLLSQLILVDNNMIATLTTVAETNRIVKGVPQSLHKLGRYAVGEKTDLIRLLGE